MNEEIFSGIDHIAQQLTEVRRNIVNDVDLEEDDREELVEALKKTVGSLSVLEDESRELQKKIVDNEEERD